MRGTKNTKEFLLNFPVTRLSFTHWPNGRELAAHYNDAPCKFATATVGGRGVVVKSNSLKRSKNRCGSWSKGVWAFPLLCDWMWGEVAAYEVATLLEARRVPITVHRTIPVRTWNSRARNICDGTGTTRTGNDTMLDVSVQEISSLPAASSAACFQHALELLCLHPLSFQHVFVCFWRGFIGTDHHESAACDAP